MSALRFEWDPRKAAANAKKHGVSFDEARSVFFDERAQLIDDPDHSGSEDRFDRYKALIQNSIRYCLIYQLEFFNFRK